MRPFFFFLALLSGFAMSSQDTIYFLNKTKETVKLVEMTSEQIKYRFLDYPDGPLLIVENALIEKVVLKNGIVQAPLNKIDRATNVKQLLGKDSDSLNSAEQISQALFNKGVKDASSHYTSKGAENAATLSTAFCAPCGLIVSAVCASVPPKMETLNYPSIEAFNNRAYELGYRKEANRIKKKRIWSGFGSGLTINFFASTFVYLAFLRYR